MQDYLLPVTVAIPSAVALILFLVRGSGLRKMLVTFFAALLLVIGMALAALLPSAAKGLTLGITPLVSGFGWLAAFANLAVLILAMAAGRRRHNSKMILLALFQAIPYMIFRIFFTEPQLIRNTAANVVSLAFISLLYLGTGGVLLISRWFMKGSAMRKFRGPEYMLLILSLSALAFLAADFSWIYFCFLLISLLMFEMMISDNRSRSREDLSREGEHLPEVQANRPAECSLRELTHAAVQKDERWFNMTLLAGLVFMTGMILAQFAKRSSMLFDFTDPLIMFNRTSFEYAIAFFCAAFFMYASSFPFQKAVLDLDRLTSAAGAFIALCFSFGISAYLLVRFALLIYGSTLGALLSVLGALCFLGASLLSLGNRDPWRRTVFHSLAAFSLLVCSISTGRHGILRIFVFLGIQMLTMVVIRFFMQTGITSKSLRPAGRLLRLLPAGAAVASRFLLYPHLADYPVIILLLIPGLALGVADFCLELAEVLQDVPFLTPVTPPDRPAESGGFEHRGGRGLRFLPHIGGDARDLEGPARLFAGAGDRLYSVEYRHGSLKDIFDRILRKGRMEIFFQICAALAFLVLFGVVTS
ncbi:MAG TPA: hypothetical protein DD727_10065 [Clostridiales bacterium]|nr:hypothetical protein [Clostridiales bacterium]